MLQETLVARAFAKHGLRLPVRISYADVGLGIDFPYLKVQSWIEALDKRGKLYKFIGLGHPGESFASLGDSLESFWQKFKLHHGGHDVFRLAEEGRMSLRQCVPVYIHGDEGITYKKDGCLCISMHCPFGRGTISNKLGPLGRHDNVEEPHLNFVGHTFETRFLLAACLRELCLQNAFVG